MKEKTMRLIMIKYFQAKGIKVVPSRGAGPDLLIDGKAVEVKGSKYDFERMLKQLMDYAYKYSDVHLALPFDGLNPKKAQQLWGLAILIEEARDIRLKTYLVAPCEGDKTFYVVEYETGLIWSSMSVPSFLKLGFDPKNPDRTKDEALENLIKYSPTKELKDHICSRFSLDVLKGERIDI